MNWQDILTDSYGRVPAFVEHTLEGLSRADLDWMPKQDCNPIGWLVWHLTRQHDAQIADLMGEEQLWTGDGWAARFSMPAEAEDTGFGYTPEQVAAFKSPGIETLQGYINAATERAQAWFKTLSEKDLNRELDEPQWNPLPTVGVRLVSIMEDAMLHAGQAAYIRGLRQGKGWQSY